MAPPALFPSGIVKLKMLKYFKNICLFDIYPKEKLNLSDFYQIRIVIDDTYNKVKDGNIWLCYFDKKYPIDTIDTKLIKDRDDVEKIAHKSIGYVSYKVTTGQIGLFFIKKDYQIEREIVINQPKTEVFNYIKSLRNQDNFSKWATMDPNMKKVYTGTDGTPGFISFWDSEIKNVKIF